MITSPPTLPLAAAIKLALRLVDHRSRNPYLYLDVDGGHLVLWVFGDRLTAAVAIDPKSYWLEQIDLGFYLLPLNIMVGDQYRISQESVMVSGADNSYSYQYPLTPAAIAVPSWVECSSPKVELTQDWIKAAVAAIRFDSGVSESPVMLHCVGDQLVLTDGLTLSHTTLEDWNGFDVPIAIATKDLTDILRVTKDLDLDGATASYSQGKSCCLFDLGPVRVTAGANPGREDGYRPIIPPKDLASFSCFAVVSGDTLKRLATFGGVVTVTTEGDSLKFSIKGDNGATGVESIPSSNVVGELTAISFNLSLLSICCSRFADGFTLSVQSPTSPAVLRNGANTVVISPIQIR